MPNTDTLANRRAEELQARERKLAEEMLDVLKRWDERLKGHHKEKRKESRRDYQTQILIRLPEAPAEEPDQPAQPPVGVRAWARNLSGNGIGFLYQGQLECTEVILCLDPDREATHWYRGTIVRSRPLQNDFWEYGVRLIGPAEIA